MVCGEHESVVAAAAAAGKDVGMGTTDQSVTAEAAIQDVIAAVIA